MSPEAVLIDYTSWRGIRRKRLVIPRRIWLGSTQWHPTQQWLLEAVDEDGTVKDFAMKDIHEWVAP